MMVMIVITILTHTEYFQLHGPILNIFYIFSFNFTTLLGSYFFFFSQKKKLKKEIKA